jgi:Protein kinase domain
MAYCCINQHLNESGKVQCVECGGLIAGALIGDYRVVSFIGNGSTSDVYLAEQHSLNKRKVVIKVLHRSYNQRHIDNFQREAALLASLSHPYILPIFSYGVIYERQAALRGCLPYLVVPYAEQGSLAESFEREQKRPWSLERVVSLAREVAEALDYAHSRNVLHRDVKPANLLQMGSHVLLSDFSVASLIDSDSSHLSGGLAGSPAYMAPEVWGMRPGRYSDQYALAVTCFVLLAGDYPLRKNGGTSARSWQQLHSFGVPSSLSEFRADVPLAVNVVLQKALAKNPHERYPTVLAFASDLLSATQDVTQQFIKRPVLAEVAQFRPALRNVEADGKQWREVQKVGVSLAKAPATDPIAFPAAPVVNQARAQGVKREVGLQDIQTENPIVSRFSNRWIWYAFVLNLLICLVLAAEYSWQAGTIRSGADLLLALCPALLVGPWLARPFRRITLTSFSWGLFWGVFFGMTNALLSALVCLIWGALLSFSGSAGGGLNNFISGVTALSSMSQVVLLVLLALWMSVIGGALIGIFSVRDEDAKPLARQGAQKPGRK